MDKQQVVYIVTFRVRGKVNRCLCFTDMGRPAVFQHSEDAELLAAQRREQHGTGVLAFEVQTVQVQ